MAYADFKYYVSDYLLGKPPAVPEEIFPYWEKQARSEVDKYTFGRISANPGLVSEKVCVCELTELLYQADGVAQQGLERGASGPLASYNNDGEAGTFDLSQSTFTEAGKAKKVREIICRYLGNTGLLYAGV